MTARFYPPAFCSVFLALCLTFLLTGAPVSAGDYMGPVFPGDAAIDADYHEPPPLPKQNTLLQRPKSKQVVFDDLDPVSSIVPQSLLHDDEEFDLPLAHVIRQRKMPAAVNRNNVFTAEGEIVQGTIPVMSDFSDDETIGDYPVEMDGYFIGPICQTFGQGVLDNLLLFCETTAYKTELHNGSGSFGLSEGLNWSTPVTPQGTITAQYGLRAVQGDNFSASVRSQCFMTAGIFKRLDFAPVQGGVAIDWLHDHSWLGSVDLRQMRCELSTRSFRGLEYGFMGGFDVFQDRPTTRQINWLARRRDLGRRGAIDVQDYYLLFIRKHLDSGGQLEFRCGATEQGDILVSALGEVAINDRLAVNGGISVLTPSEGPSRYGNYRESWSMSLGIVLYFRGGAVCRQTNLYRPMFDVAGNNSLFTRIVGR